ncbi:hypothetical protein D3C83_162480 [compost metagenome]
MSELVSPDIEFAVSDLLVFADDRYGFRRSFCLFFKQLMNKLVFGVVGLGVVPFD